jgi:hypothetical protein
MRRKASESCFLWLSVPIHASVWRVFVCDSDCPQLAENEGVTVHRRSEVHIDGSMECSRIVAVLGHELVHVCFTHANAEAQASIFGCHASDIDAANERIAVYMGPQLMEGLQRAGLLKLPRLPR